MRWNVNEMAWYEKVFAVQLVRYMLAACVVRLSVRLSVCYTPALYQNG